MQHETRIRQSKYMFNWKSIKIIIFFNTESNIHISDTCMGVGGQDGLLACTELNKCVFLKIAFRLRLIIKTTQSFISFSFGVICKNIAFSSWN